MNQTDLEKWDNGGESFVEMINAPGLSPEKQRTPMETFPEYCSQCLDCEHEGPCAKYWAEDLEQWVWYEDELVETGQPPMGELT